VLLCLNTLKIHCRREDEGPRVLKFGNTCTLAASYAFRPYYLRKNPLWQLDHRFAGRLMTPSRTTPKRSRGPDHILYMGSEFIPEIVCRLCCVENTAYRVPVVRDCWIGSGIFVYFLLPSLLKKAKQSTWDNSALIFILWDLHWEHKTLFKD
jgi:hypothetical protein